ncbi:MULTISPECIES: hypothetical protein [Halorussus]|uniref:hypothetical protein n=1 Tax=Halorussus TaxID=1070314 RepID=UPI0020A1B60B|nr:hypothetical protein [Halorussus vallis]USZ76930.1 hypothetical protein NGM07_06265 [Halorussus vallis]
MNADGTDPGVVHTVVVTTDDVVAAYEARRRTPSRRTVLRATPPFSGRMRARLHVVDEADEDGRTANVDPQTGAIHLHPDRLVDEDAVEAFPHPDDTEDRLREDPDEEFSVERHHERHAEAVEAWRESVAAAVVETLELRTGGSESAADGRHRVAVKKLG